tara:strand:+ start:464 stop:1210 length:747 start_codon:yes stop_codon:yes gene_type:complete
MEKYLLLNKSSTDSASEGYLTIPVKSFQGAHPSSDTALELYFTPTINHIKGAYGNNNIKVTLTVKTNTHKEVLEVLSKEFTTGENIYIEIDKETSTYPTADITNVTYAYSTKTTFNIGWNGFEDRLKILPRDFIGDDGGRPIMINDSTSDRYTETYSTTKAYASVPIPKGFEATGVLLYGSATSAIEAYSADINGKAVTSLGTGNIGTPLNFTSSLVSDDTNYLLIEVDQASGEQVFGGYVIIRAVYA